MKAITLSDNSPKNPTPWLSLVEFGFKTIETRVWKTSYRGDLLLCGAADSRTPNKGLATCIVKVVDCVPMEKIHEIDACIEAYPKAWAWITEDLRWLSEKFPVKGSLGFFNVDIPAKVEIYKPAFVFPDTRFTMANCPEYLQKFLKDNTQL
nr:ASCH domain-containing protein [uncultured Arsenicibacter sp.]